MKASNWHGTSFTLESVNGTPAYVIRNGSAVLFYSVDRKEADVVDHLLWLSKGLAGEYEVQQSMLLSYHDYGDSNSGCGEWHLDRSTWK